MAKITIIIPVYNAENYIQRCMDSVLRQTYEDFDVILINDGSSDNSLELCRNYSKKDRRVTVLDKSNGGAASARNMGLEWFFKNLDSEWLCFIDIDDFVHEQYLEILLNAAKEAQTNISMCSYEVTKDKETLVNTDNVAVHLMQTEQLWCERQINCTVPFSKLFHRELFCGIRFPEGIIHEDEFTLYKVLFQCEQIAFVELPLYSYYQTEVSVMRGEWTPRHMSEPDGLFEQLRFFIKNHYDEASHYTARIYLYSIYRNFMGAKKSKEYQPEAKSLKKRLCKELIRYRTLAGISIGSESWMFYAAYPIATLPYRTYTKVMKIVNRSHH